MKRLDRSSRARPAAGARPPGPTAEAEMREIDIAEMGARGDAIAETSTGPIYVPFALPGERVRVRLAGERGDLQEVVRASPERVAPVCPHFGVCGGCQLQHWALEAQSVWKREQLVRALARRGLETDIGPTVEAWGAGRRRAALHAQVRHGRLRFGFVGRGERGVVAIEKCPVLAPRLAERIGDLRRIAVAFAPGRAEITLPVLDTDAGLDVMVKGAGAPARFDRERLEAAATLAEALDLARLSFDGETLAARRTPLVRMGEALVAPPPGAFLQPTAAGEEALAQLVAEAVGEAGQIADLFCGVGTFALRLAAKASVLAVEGDDAMCQALRAAADASAGRLKPIRVERRDLLRAPISALELKKIEAVVFDPPRCGARLQAEQIARSKVEKVAAVACDAATFARDARILTDGGFRLAWARPVDQFRHSPHIEIVAAFVR
jgi:23S rRNA (uracil1939-C5)-methyltransferase